MPVCALCGLRMADNLLNRHLGLVHKYDADFRISCVLGGCQKTYTKWSSYCQHMWRIHNSRTENNDDNPEDENGANNGEEVEDVDMDNIAGGLGDAAGGQPDAQREPLSPREKLHFQCALYVGKLHEKFLIPQSTIEKIVEGTALLLQDYLKIVKDTLLEGNEGVENVPVNTIKKVFRDAEPSDIFQSCKTSHHFKSFMASTLGLVEPVKTEVGERDVWTNAVTVRRVKSYAYVVPFLKSLELCLNNEDVLKCVENPLPHDQGVLKSVTDGMYYRNHPIYAIDNKALSIMIYYDDVEYTNPLGSKTHKVAMFYWVLQNIYPEFRSTLKVHNLLAVIMSKDLKLFGTERLLQNFISDINQLGGERGVVLTVRGVNRVFHGFLNTVAGDTPAAGYLGGFKEGVGWAKHPCRRCNITKEEIKVNFDVFSFNLRTLDEHKRQIEILSSAGLTPRAMQFWSKQFGVNSRSPLLDIANFDVTRCLPHDLMHVVLEGTLACHMLLFIKHCVNENKFTLNDFNSALTGFEYKGFKKDRPSRVEPSHLDNGLRQSAAQMLALGQTLPFIIGQWMDQDVQDHLNVFILLMQIVNLALAFELHEDDADLLNLIIQIHHIRFKALYGSDAITPKWHYMLHLSEQILLFGPPRQHWCMRFEGLHSYFKNVSSRNKNFKNLCYTFSSRRQQLQCIEFANMPGVTPKKFLDLDPIFTGKRIRFAAYAHHEIVNIYLHNVQPDSMVLLTDKLQVMGTCFNDESVILLDVPREAYPSFGKVNEIIVWEDLKVIVYSELKTESYEPNLNAYKVTPREQIGAIALKNLRLKHSLPLFKHGSAAMVLLTYHRHTEFVG